MKEPADPNISGKKPNKRALLLLIPLLLLMALLLIWFRRGPSELDLYKAQLLSQCEVLDMDKLAPKRTGNEPDGDAPLLEAAKKLGGKSIRSSIDSLPNLRSNNLLSVSWISTSRITNQTQRTALWQQCETAIQAKRADISEAALLLQNPPKDKGADYRLRATYPRIDFVTRRDVAQFFTGATLVDAHAGRAAEAYSYALALADVCDLEQEEWTVINQFVRISIARMALQTYSYGLGTAGWSEPQLAHLQSRLTNLSLVTNTYQALVFSRAEGVGLFNECRTNKQIFTNMFSNPNAFSDQFMTLYWSKVNREKDELLFLHFNQTRLDYFRQQMKSPAFAGGTAFFQAQTDALVKGTESKLPFNQLWLTSLLTSDFSKALSALVVTETIRQQTITAIALERYRLKQGKYPEKLMELIPDYLAQIPSDPMDGRPMRYRLNPDGTFTLWSVGFDGKDDGGDITMPDSKKQNFPQDAKDLVWPRIDPIDLPPKK